MAIKDYLWSIFLRKVLTGAVLGFLSTQGGNLAGAGITVDQVAFVAFLTGALNGARNYAKIKLGWAWLP